MDESGASEGTSTSFNPMKIINRNEKAEGLESSSALTDTGIQNSLTEQNGPLTKWLTKSSSISQLKSKGISVVKKKRHNRLHGFKTHSLQKYTTVVKRIIIQWQKGG